MNRKYSVAILGSASVGKKSLANLLAKDENYQFYVDELPERVDGVILLFSLVDRNSFVEISSFCDFATEKYGEVPMMMCANKADRKDRVIGCSEVVTSNNAHIDKTCGLQHLEVSCKSLFHTNKILPILEDLIEGRPVPSRGCILLTEENCMDIALQILGGFHGF